METQKQKTQFVVVVGGPAAAAVSPVFSSLPEAVQELSPSPFVVVASADTVAAPAVVAVPSVAAVIVAVFL